MNEIPKTNNRNSGYRKPNIGEGMLKLQRLITRGLKLNRTSIRYPTRPKRKHKPHQGAQECARRVRQMQRQASKAA